MKKQLPHSVPTWLDLFLALALFFSIATAAGHFVYQQKLVQDADIRFSGQKLQNQE